MHTQIFRKKGHTIRKTKQQMPVSSKKIGWGRSVEMVFFLKNYYLLVFFFVFWFI